MLAQITDKLMIKYITENRSQKLDSGTTQKLLNTLFLWKNEHEFNNDKKKS